MKNHNVKIVLILLLSAFLFYKCEDEKKAQEKSTHEELFWLTRDIQNQPTDPCTDSYWTPGGSYSGYMVLFDTNKSKISCAGASTSPPGGMIFYTNGNNIGTFTLSQQTPRTPLQCKHNNPSLGGYQFSENSWYKQDANNPRNANFLFKHTLQKDSNGNIIGMDSFTNYNSGDILFCCDQPGQYPLCGKLQIN